MRQHPPGRPFSRFENQQPQPGRLLVARHLCPGIHPVFRAHPGASPVGSLDLGPITTFSLDLPRGASFYMALQAYNDDGTSGLSNVEKFTITGESPRLNGAWEGAWTAHAGDETGNFTVQLIIGIHGRETQAGSEKEPKSPGFPFGRYVLCQRSYKCQ